jgi:hypothetical protein
MQHGGTFLALQTDKAKTGSPCRKQRKSSRRKPDGLMVHTGIVCGTFSDGIQLNPFAYIRDVA